MAFRSNKTRLFDRHKYHKNWKPYLIIINRSSLSPSFFRRLNWCYWSESLCLEYLTIKRIHIVYNIKGNEGVYCFLVHGKLLNSCLISSCDLTIFKSQVYSLQIHQLKDDPDEPWWLLMKRDPAAEKKHSQRKWTWMRGMNKSRKSIEIVTNTRATGIMEYNEYHGAIVNFV